MISIREYALRLITIKDRTEKELRTRLADKGYDAEDIEAQLQFLKEYNYIDDQKYAEHFANDCVNLKKWGRARIKMELIKRGIDKEIAESAAEMSCEESGDILLSQMQKKFQNADMESPKERARIFGYFARRGFLPDEIKGAMNKISAFKDIEE